MRRHPRYRSAGQAWQAVNIGKAPSTPDIPIFLGAAHDQISGHCLGVVCRTLAVVGYAPRATRNDKLSLSKTVHCRCTCCPSPALPHTTHNSTRPCRHLSPSQPSPLTPPSGPPQASVHPGSPPRRSHGSLAPRGCSPMRRKLPVPGCTAAGSPRKILKTCCGRLSCRWAAHLLAPQPSVLDSVCALHGFIHPHDKQFRVLQMREKKRKVKKSAADA